MSELVATRIREHAERLRLTHLAEGLDGLVDRAEQQTMGYLDFLDLILEEEVGVREGRRFRNALKLSGLPHHKGLDGFDFAFQPDLDARKVRDLAALGFVETRANVAFLGPPGVGKTMLAVGLAIAACQAGHSVYFTTLDDLVRNLKEAEASGRFAKKLQTYLKPAVLVVDEVQTGFGRTGKMWGIEHYEVEPDLMCLAKSIAAGLPLSGVIGRAEIMDAPGDSAVGGTYVGNPVAIAAATWRSGRA